MKQTISTSLTAFYKAMTLIISGVMFPFATVMITIAEGWKGLVVIPIFTVIAFILISWALRISDVEIVETGFHVSRNNFGKKIEIFVPFEDVEYADQFAWLRGGTTTVAIKLKKKTALGSTIRFIPKRQIDSMSEHPVVEEINKLLVQQIHSRGT